MKVCISKCWFEVNIEFYSQNYIEKYQKTDINIVL